MLSADVSIFKNWIVKKAGWRFIPTKEKKSYNSVVLLNKEYMTRDNEPGT